MTVLKPSSHAVTFPVLIVPRASKNQIIGKQGDQVKIRLNAPPVDGRANEALVMFLAASLGVSRRQIEIVAGASSRHKLVRITGVTAKQIEEMTKK